MYLVLKGIFVISKLWGNIFVIVNRVSYKVYSHDYVIYVTQDVADDLWKSTFKLEQSMSVHALYGRDKEQVEILGKR